MKLPSILALDPGGTTGYFYRGPKKENVYGQLQPGHHLKLWQLMQACLHETLKNDLDAKLTIVCEEFEYRKDAEAETREKIEYISKEYIGVVKLFRDTYPHQVYLRMQSASIAKQFWKMDKVKKVGLWPPGKKHASDAIKHYLYYVTFTLKDDRYLNMLGKPA